MNIISNETLIKRNKTIAKYSMIAGLAVLGGGMLLTMRPASEVTRTQIALSLVALIVGFILSQIGIYYTNHWGRSPRADEHLNKSLKGLDKRYTIYHYNTPVSHLLVGPTGVWVLLPRSIRGKITYSGDRWREIGGNPFGFYLRSFVRESLGRPEQDLQSDLEKLNKFLGQHLEAEQIPPIQAALVMLDPRSTIDIPADENPPAETVTLADLKELIRKGGRGRSLSPEKIQLIQHALPSG